jgi:hypothetical protein
LTVKRDIGTWRFDQYAALEDAFDELNRGQASRPNIDETANMRWESRRFRRVTGRIAC